MSGESEMVERVASTLYERCVDASGSWLGEAVWAAAATPQKEAFRAHARAVIEAMREPTEEMVKAGAIDPDGYLGPGEAKTVWRRMHNAALGKDEGSRHE